MSDPKITRVLSSVGTTRTLEMDDGSVVTRSGGTVSWRNNNPGNLKFEFSGSADKTVHNPRTREQALDAAQDRYKGIVGLDQWGNAVFESYEAGRAAKIQLLERRFSEKTVEQMLPSYSTADYSGRTHHKEQAAAIFAEGDRQGVDLREKTVGQMSEREREVLADGIRRFEGWRAGELTTTQQPTHAQSAAPVQVQTSSSNAPAGTAPTTTTHRATAASGAAVYNEAYQHFLGKGRSYEYGRPDHPRPGRDSSRLERDMDEDGRLGVDCSAFVWRGLKNAGYDVPGENAASFTTAKLFNGTNPTSYAREHFDVTSAAEARKPNGSLHQGDILMFSSPQGQHVGIFKGYDAKGNIQFIGSQGSTGPAEVTITPGGYWDGRGTNIVGALTPKPEFQVRAPLHGTAEPSVARTHATASVVLLQSASNEAAPHHSVKHGVRGDDVRSIQQDLNRLGVRDAQGNRLAEDGRFGDNTREAVLAFQKQHGLQQDGIVGRNTQAALSAAQAQTQVPARDTQIAAPTGPSLTDASHPDHALHSAIRSRLPSMISNETAANVTLQAKQNGIDSADKLQSVTVQDGKAFVMGTTPGFRAAVDLNQPAPTLEQTSAQLLAGQAQQQHAHAEHQKVAMGVR
ncbi:peptidoglycan-binding protein [Xanthomonas nasturtii]|uniref:Peptidoglycan-binding protein n=1 Tax=Xanthomonas nasturtii TaxID=1843581 RepID=A0A3E1KFW2_9XANT|nr:peptidoglycan-binding protein [Xanthomonas nasturtii]MCL1529097.1 peptidoglycan-binding protein [Xanthomonas nasturtii]MCL1566687.1 peptidoglycan-binding protein [Xanthomonas nasturtii]MCL1569346.1 peptidoglycan-binding protein [Xanthomonas nasturtii]MCL1573706.1 peptidoglycan-binding protein [Xanthomonas nasturtii]MCL1579118.1 peptidoglycan-binding protein [Xanthomonas nasturtii]